MPRIMENPKLKKKASQMLARGYQQVDVARELGVSPPTVSRFVKREEVQALIRQEAMRFAELLPDAVSISRDVITAGKREAARAAAGDQVDMKLLETALKEGEAVRKSTGVTPTHTGSTLVTNVLIGEPVGLSPILRQLLATVVGNGGGIPETDNSD